MDLNELNEWINTEEGAAWLNEQKAGLIKKKEELLSENRELREHAKIVEQRATKIEQEVSEKREAAEKRVVDDAFKAVIDGNVIKGMGEIFRQWIVSQHEVSVQYVDDEPQAMIFPKDAEEPVPFQDYFASYFDIGRMREEGDETPKWFMPPTGSGGGLAVGGSPFSHDYSDQSGKNSGNLSESVLNRMGHNAS
mgnify:FL=1